MLLHTTYIKEEKGIYYITEKKDDFSNTYIQVRDLEKRVYSDQVVGKLPYVAKNHHYFKEWKLRQASTQNILKYLKKKHKPLKILDLGCGNGWFSHQLSELPNSKVFAVDVNDIELSQAARVFNQSNLQFIYADIFAPEATVLKDFDIITVNSCIQYFENLPNIINRLKNMLTDNGELHIIDSPFYKSSEIEAAKERTNTYYTQLGVPEMANYYYHHTLQNLGSCSYMYTPNTSLVRKIFRKNNNPFYWIKILK